MNDANSFVNTAIGLSLGVALAMAILYFPLQDSDKRLAERLDKLEKRR